MCFQLFIVLESICKVEDQVELGVRFASPVHFDQQAVPGTPLDITLSYELSDDVSGTETECIDKHVNIVQITTVLDVCFAVRISLIADQSASLSCRSNIRHTR